VSLWSKSSQNLASTEKLVSTALSLLGNQSRSLIILVISTALKKEKSQEKILF
jgi:hypothetical protein